MDTQHPSQPVRLDAAQRDVVYWFVANDLDDLGAELREHAGHQGGAELEALRLTSVERLRTRFSLLDEIGWSREDQRDAFVVTVERDKLIEMIAGWRESVDRWLGDTPRDPSPVVRDEAARDVERWLKLDRLLEQVQS